MATSMKCGMCAGTLRCSVPASCDRAGSRTPTSRRTCRAACAGLPTPPPRSRISPFPRRDHHHRHHPSRPSRPRLFPADRPRPAPHPPTNPTPPAAPLSLSYPHAPPEPPPPYSLHHPALLLSRHHRVPSPLAPTGIPAAAAAPRPSISRAGLPCPAPLPRSPPPFRLACPDVRDVDEAAFEEVEEASVLVAAAFEVVVTILIECHVRRGPSWEFDVR